MMKASQTEVEFVDGMREVRETFGGLRQVSDKWINVLIGPQIEIHARGIRAAEGGGRK